MNRDRLLLDAMLGRLCSYLRMCGYDACYGPDEGLEDDEAIRERARADGRTVVTRDRALAARSGGVLLEAREIEPQLEELADAGFELSLPAEPSRCGVCNGRLERAAPEEPVPEYVPDQQERVWRCRACGQHFWKGSHWEDVARRLSDVSGT